MFNFIFRKWLKLQKWWLLKGVKQDMEYIRTFQGDLILVDTEDRLRAKLADERKKQKPDDSVVEKIANDIATAIAVRSEYEKLKKLEVELPLYMSIL